MFRFPVHWPHPGMLEEQPVIGFDGFWRALGVGDAVVIVIRVNQILHDGPRIEQPNLSAIGVNVCQFWDATVWVNGEEPGFLVSIFRGIDFVNAVGQSIRVSECAEDEGQD